MKDRSKAVDFLRFVAVILVLFRHFDTANIGDDQSLLYDIVRWLNAVGWVGVDLFFVISGYLVSGLIFDELDRTTKFDARRFLVRRGFKIYPGFYFFLFTTGIYFGLQGDWRWTDLLKEAVYIQNYSPAIWNHTWSLAVEEHFYFFLAFLASIGVSMKVSHKSFRLIYCLLALIMATMISRLVYLVAADLNHNVSFYTHIRIDGLLFGVTIAALSRYHKTAFNAWQKYSFHIILVLFPMVIYFWMKDFYSEIQIIAGFTANYIFFGTLLIFLLQVERHFSRNAILAYCARLGFFSYSIYLWHMCCKFWIVSPLTKAFGLNYFMQLSIYLISAICIGILFSKIIEIPFLSLRERFFPQTKAAEVVAVKGNQKEVLG